MSNLAEINDRKFLNRAACQGCIILSRGASIEDSDAATVLNLKDRGYLKISTIEESTVTYVLTDKGKQYLKSILNVKREVGTVPQKHNPAPEVVTENSGLEVILTKRLNILKSAKKRGLEFNLTDANIKTLLNKKTCYYTGVAFDENNDPMNARTFERLDDTKGYVKDNVVAVTLRANRIKNILLEQDNELKIGITQFLMMANKIKNFK